MSKAVLLIPPTGGSSATWGRYADELASTARVITYDRTPGCPLAEQAQEAGAVIEQHSDEPVAVVGVSLGATVALRLAVDNPSLVSALHLHEPPFHAKKHPNLETIRAVIRMQKTARRDKSRAAEEFIRWAYTRTDGGCAFDEWPQQWRDIALSNPGAVIHDIGIATGESITNKDLGGLTTTPALSTTGELSRPYTRSLARRLADRLPLGTCVDVPGAGHGAVFEQPERLASLTRKIASAPAQAAPSR